MPSPPVRRELRHVISNLGEPVDEDELEQMMAEADKDGAHTALAVVPPPTLHATP